MSIISSLRANAQTLNVQSTATSIAGENIANVNNPDYARKRIELGETGATRTSQGIQGAGLKIQAITQLRDEVLDEQIVLEKISRSSLEAQSQYLQRLEVVYGEKINRDSALDTLNSGDTASTTSDGLSKNLDDFFNSFEELAANPTSLPLKQDVMSKATTLVEKFNTTASDLEDLSSNLQKNIENDVTRVNQLLESIGELNKNIARLEINDEGSAIDSRNQRQKQIEELASYINFTPRQNFFDSSMTDIIIKDASGLAIPIIDGSSVPALISFNSTTNTIEYPKTSQPLDITGGSIHGMISVRAESIPTLQTELNTLAHQLTVSVNSAYNPTYDDGTNPGPAFVTTGDFFARPATGSVATAATIALDLNPRQPDGYPAPPNDAVVPLSVDTLKTSVNAGGGNDLVRAVADLRDYEFASGNTDEFMTGTYFTFMEGVTTRLGNEVFKNEEQLENQTTLDNFLEQQRQSYSGVNMDEELTDLLKYQRSFQGTSRVINVLDSLLELVVAGLAR